MMASRPLGARLAEKLCLPNVDIGTARKLLGSDKIIGISTNTVEEAITACEQGADYLGIGTVFSTQT